MKAVRRNRPHDGEDFPRDLGPRKITLSGRVVARLVRRSRRSGASFSAPVYGYTAFTEPAFRARLRIATSAKHCLGAIAAGLVSPGSTAFVDAGSTCLEAGCALLARGDAPIVTNSLPLLVHADQLAAPILALSGRLRPISQALVGLNTLRDFSERRFDVAIVGASGIDLWRGPATTESTEAAVKAAALACARWRILLVHAAKWAITAPVVFAPWSAFTHVVTDARLAESSRARLRRAGIQLLGPASA